MTALPDPAAAQRAYVLVVLAALSALNQLDRQLMNILIEPIRGEFGLSDVQLGLLAGLAFVALYSVLSIPAAIRAVGHGRRDLLAVSAAVWGVTTMLCGVAQSYWQLLLARLGVGIGEAGGMPPSHAMISDLYPPGERAAAMATWSAGINAGIFFAYLVGGYVGHRWGWRTAFVAAGGVTVLFALLLRLTVPEPRQSTPNAPPSAGLVAQTWRLMRADPVLRQLCLGATVTAVVGYAGLAWLPSYLVRSHGMTIASAGAFLAVVVGLGGAAGTWLGGRLSDHLRRRDIRWSLWLVAAVILVGKPFSFGFLLADSTAVALALFVLPGLTGAIYLGPSLAVLHNRVDAPMRPVASALFLLLLTLIGLGLGPLLAGALSQYVFFAAGADSLRYGLAAIQALGAWGALHYYLAGRRLAAAPPR